MDSIVDRYALNNQEGRRACRQVTDILRQQTDRQAGSHQFYMGNGKTRMQVSNSLEGTIHSSENNETSQTCNRQRGGIEDRQAGRRRK